MKRRRSNIGECAGSARAAKLHSWVEDGHATLTLNSPCSTVSASVSRESDEEAGTCRSCQESELSELSTQRISLMRKKKPWDFTLNDMSQYKLSWRELQQRRRLRQSKHITYGAALVREQQAKHKAKRRREREKEAEAKERRHFRLSVMRGKVMLPRPVTPYYNRDDFDADLAWQDSSDGEINSHPLQNEQDELDRELAFAQREILPSSRRTRASVASCSIASHKNNASCAPRTSECGEPSDHGQSNRNEQCMGTTRTETTKPTQQPQMRENDPAQKLSYRLRNLELALGELENKQLNTAT